MINLSITPVSAKSLHMNGSSAHITLIANPGPLGRNKINKSIVYYLIYIILIRDHNDICKHTQEIT